MLVIRVGFHKMLIRIANREDTDQTASEKQSDLDPSCLSSHFCHAIIDKQKALGSDGVYNIEIHVVLKIGVSAVY